MNLNDIPNELKKYPIDTIKAYLEIYNAHESEGQEEAIKHAKLALETKTFTTNFIGTMPAMSDEWTDSTMFANAEVKFSGVNYTDNPDMIQYMPMFAAWNGRVIEASTGDVKIDNAQTFAEGIMEAWNSKRLDTNLNQPLGVDYQHSTYKSEAPVKELIGYVTDIKTYEGKLKTFTSDGKIAEIQIPDNAIYIMAKIGWLKKGQELLAEGSRPYPSIVFSENEGIYTIGTPTITAKPADKTIPAWVMNEGKELETKEMEVIQLTPKEELIAFINELSDEEAGALLAKLKQPETETPVNEAEKPQDTAAFTAEEIGKLRALITPQTALESPKPETPDEGVTAAKAVLAGLPQVKFEDIDKIAANFKGMEASKVVTALEARFEKRPEGSQVIEAGNKKGEYIPMSKRPASGLLNGGK